MLKYDIILTDLDGTLFDFLASSGDALDATFRTFGYAFTQADQSLFFDINEAMWKDFEVGKIEKSSIYEGRFRKFLDARGWEGDEKALNACYMPHLQEGHHLMPGSLELMENLKKKGCTICAITNGETKTQLRRIADSGLGAYMDHLFISEEMGCNKPAKLFFDKVFAVLGDDLRDRAIVLGDSLTSDMQGGRNAGLATCFLGSADAADDRCDYVISDLSEFPAVIEGEA